MPQILSTSIPQDVIDEIIEHLQDDMTTLKTCSLASRAIYEPTRKYIFATITLASPDAVSSLIQTLEENPNLSTHIRSLEIPELNEDTLRRIVPILPALAHTRHLVLGKDTYIHAVHVPSAPVLAFLSTLLRQLPFLVKLEIRSIRGFPASHLAVAQVTTLSIINSAIARGDGSQEVPVLACLRSLHLARVWCWYDAPAPIVNAPGLREIVITAPKNAVRPVLQAGVESIETVVWVGYMHGRDYAMVDLGVLRNLRKLCFALSGGDGVNPHVRTTWDPISRILRSGVNPQTLEELSFSIKKALDEPTTIPILELLGLGDMWTDLADTRQFPKLTKVVVRLVYEGCESPALGADAFYSVVAQKLPLLVEAGLLCTAVQEIFHWRAGAF